MAAIDLNLAKFLVQVCEFAYDFDVSRLPGLANPPHQIFHDRPPVGEPTSYAVLLDYPDRRILAFQGTITEFNGNANTHKKFASIEDWLQNFKVLLAPAAKYGNKFSAKMAGRLHDGFARQLALIYDDIKAALNAANASVPKPLLITGHSQGGAIAAIAKSALECDGFAISSTYTFAAPRPGDGTFAKSVTNVCRIEFGDDIVPHVPPREQFLDDPRIQFLIEHLPRILKVLSQKVSTGVDTYMPVGTLTYRRKDLPLLRDLSPADDDALTKKRILWMFTAGPNLIENHHLSRIDDAEKLGKPIMCYESMFD